jgi:hypothetical protein
VPSYRFTRPAITWGALFANTFNIGYPLDNVKAGSEPRVGSAFDQSQSGLEDSWVTGIDYLLIADVRWIPQVNVANPLATGWDGATGVRAWLEWARQKNLMRFIPDVTVPGTYITCYLVDPMKGAAASETDGSRKLTITLRNSTTAYDGY